MIRGMDAGAPRLHTTSSETSSSADSRRRRALRRSSRSGSVCVAPRVDRHGELNAFVALVDARPPDDGRTRLRRRPRDHSRA